MVTKKSKIAKPRRSNIERSADTKDKIINAAIQCIFDLGYEGTSLQLVADRAGLSKGATQHHFSSKTTLMLAVANYCLQLHSEMRYSHFDKYPPGAERMSKTAETSWEIINHPSYTALIEIMMATRNNAELKKNFAPLVEFIAAERQRGVDAFCEHFNVEPNPMVEILIRTHVTSMRGIAVGMMFNPNKKAFRAELEMMQRYEQMMREFIVTEFGKK